MKIFVAFSLAFIFASLGNLCAGHDSQQGVFVEGGTLPTASQLAGQSVASFFMFHAKVTLGEWDSVAVWAKENGYELSKSGDGSDDDGPAKMLSWYDCVKWCNAKSDKEGLRPVYLEGGSVYRKGEFGKNGSGKITADPNASGYRLPTEVEWEWVVRGGDVTAKNSTHSSIARMSEKMGVKGMISELAEWCFDECLAEDGSYRRVRGGNWKRSEEEAAFNRGYEAPDVRFYNSSLRLARNSQNTP